jgi:hypothetical protein
MNTYRVEVIDTDGDVRLSHVTDAETPADAVILVGETLIALGETTAVDEDA